MLPPQQHNASKPALLPCYTKMGLLLVYNPGDVLQAVGAYLVVTEYERVQRQKPLLKPRRWNLGDLVVVQHKRLYRRFAEITRAQVAL